MMAFWILMPCFMLDAVLNAGILIANNGFMIKNSPTENRTMYIAATQAIAGMVGGVTSILAGWIMQALAGQQWTVAGWTFGNFQVMFITSIALRWLALGMTRYVQEPQARHTWDVVQELVSDMLDRLEIRLPQQANIESGPEQIISVPAPSNVDFVHQDSASDEAHPRVPAPKRLRKPRTRILGGRGSGRAAK